MRTLHFLAATSLVMMMAGVALANEADTVKVQRKIVKSIQVTEDGKTVTDTTIVLEGDDLPYFFRGDCKFFPGNGMMMHRQMVPGKGRGMAWHSDEDVEIMMDGDSSKVMIFRRPGHEEREFRFEHRPGGKGMMHWNENDFAPRVEHLQLQHQNRRNLIDLNDPSVISFERSQQKDGTEKITIIRKTEK